MCFLTLVVVGDIAGYLNGLWQVFETCSGPLRDYLDTGSTDLRLFFGLFSGVWRCCAEPYPNVSRSRADVVPKLWPSCMGAVCSLVRS
ncbi:hypothetical protein G5B00_07105 [Parapedobacter sp. SGR-10]|uniref:hypothetical protein n=1 Tax=Parapedobacter sp. SGR-10 TaxID=2710879 RepID=UPI0013D2C452|nr:hypothetical protein [Parapedobacter sp. SGR-10]NGF56280.1 hypothetical protein [Parapedobacter sp. SGR-10]